MGIEHTTYRCENHNCDHGGCVAQLFDDLKKELSDVQTATIYSQTFMSFTI